MKMVLVCLLSFFALPALARDFSGEFGGVCVVHAYGRSDIFHAVRVPFRLPRSAVVTREHTRGIDTAHLGVGTALVQQDIEMMDARKNIIVVPIKIELTVTLSADQKRKTLSGGISMFNIFRERTENFVVNEANLANLDVFDGFAYFQKGFNSTKTNAASDEIVGSSIFCSLDDNQG